MADDLQDILDTLIAEGYAEGPEGMRRIAETIINRSAIRGQSFGDIVRAPAQYTGYSRPGAAAVEAQKIPSARTAAQAAWELAMQPGDPTDGSDHYKANYVDPYWADKMPKTGSYGDHDFYRSRPVPQEALAALLTRSSPTPADMPASVARSRAVQDATNNLAGAPMRAPSIEDMYAGIFAQPAQTARPNLTQGGAIDRSIQGVQQNPAMADALQAFLAPKSAAPVASRSAGVETMRRANQMATDAERNSTIVATIPTTGVGEAPRTRSVASVAVPAQDPDLSAPKAQDFADMFGRPASVQTANAAIDEAFGPSGYSNPNKNVDRLPATAGANAFAPGPDLFGGLDPRLARAAPIPFSGAEAALARAPKVVAKPATRTITERVPNPDWTADLATSKVPAGMKVNFGSRDSVAQRAAGQAAKVPQFITRTRTVAATPTAALAAQRSSSAPIARPVAQRAPLRVLVQGSNTQQPNGNGGGGGGQSGGAPTIKGHSTGSDGIRYDPDVGSHVYDRNYDTRR